MSLLDDIENVAQRVGSLVSGNLSSQDIEQAKTIEKQSQDLDRKMFKSVVGRWILNIPKTATELADSIYSVITGKNPHWVIKTNDETKKFLGVRLYQNAPTTEEIYKNPEQALRRAFHNNDPDTIRSILDIASKNPQSYRRALRYFGNHFIQDFKAVNKGQAGTKTKSLLAHEYNIMTDLVNKKQMPKDYLNIAMHNLKIFNSPEFKTAQSVIKQYQTINKAIDIVNLAGLGLSIFGGIGGKIADEGLAFAVSKLLETGGAVMMGVGTLADAKYNKRDLSEVLSPINLSIFADAIRGMKEVPEALQTKNALDKLKDPNFNITDWITTNLYNPKTKQEDLNELNATLKSVEKTAKANFKPTENFIKNLNRFIGDKAGAILDKILSDYRKERMLIQEAKSFIDGFYNSDTVKEFFKPYIKDDGSVVIPDANEVEARFAEEAKKNPIINNFMKLVRQTRLTSVLRQAIDNGNKDVQVFVYDLGSEEPVKHFIYQMTDPLENIINELEPHWQAGNNVVVKYHNRDGQLISRTIKATYHPTYDDFRIIKGNWRVLDHNGQWKDIEEDITIPVHSIGDIKGEVEDILRSKYQNVDMANSQIKEIIKPASSIFPYKLNQIANRLISLQIRLEKKAFTEFSKHEDILNDLKKSAIDNGFLTEEEAKDISDPRDLFPVLRNRINEAKKSLLTATKYSFDNLKQNIKETKKAVINTYKANSKDLLANIDKLKEGMKPIKDRLKDEASYLRTHRKLGDLLNKFEKKLNHVEQTYWGIFKDQKEEKDFRDFIEQARNLGILPTHRSVEDYLKMPSVEVIEHAKNNLLKLYDEYIDTTKDMRNYAEKVLVDEGDAFAKLLKLKPITDKNLIEQIKGGMSNLQNLTNTLSKSTEYNIRQDISTMQNLINKLFISNKDYLTSEGRLMTAVGKEGSKLREIAETIQRLAKTHPSDMTRAGSGFVKRFNSYEDFADYGKLKYLAPILSNFKSMNFLAKLYDELNENEKYLNETQKLIKNFLGMVLYKDPNNFAKAQRLLGSLITTLSVPIFLSLSITGFKNAHILFPSLDLLKLGDIGKAWMKEYKKFIYGQGIYKVNALNPFSFFSYGLLKAHILANLKDDNIFNNVIKDYAKYVGLDSEDGINMLKEAYKDDREKFAETLSEIATGSDPKSLLPLFVEHSQKLETVMPWYRYITAPFSMAIEVNKRWFKDLPDYITEHGKEKALAKPLALGLFTTALLGTQSSMWLSAPQTAYNIIQTGVSLLAPVFGYDKDVFPEGSLVSIVGGMIGHEFNIDMLKPEEKMNFYTEFGSSLLHMIASATGTHIDTSTAGKWLATGLNIFTNLGSVGVLSPSAGAYSMDIPVPALSVIKNMMRPYIFDKTDAQKYVDMATELIRSVPALNNFYKDIVGRTIATHMGEHGHTDIYDPSFAQEFLSKDAQGFFGLLHAIGFIASSFVDGVLDTNELNKVATLIQYELHPEEHDSPVKPPNVSYIPILNGRDYTIGLQPLSNLVGAINSLTPEHKQIVFERFRKIINTNIDKMNKLLKKPTLTPDDVDQLKQRFQSLQNMAIALIETKSVDEKHATALRVIYNEAYNLLKNRQIDVDYNNMLREKRELKK